MQEKSNPSGSRPLYGGLLSQYNPDVEYINIAKVLVPSTGVSYLNLTSAVVDAQRSVLVPSTGVSYLNPVPYTSQNTRLLSPICGANLQMREISISNWCITFSKPDFKPIGAKSLYFLKFNPPHPHMIQLSLILCTFTDMRCQFKLQVFGMFMHNIISAQCIYNISFVILPYNNHFFIFNFRTCPKKINLSVSSYFVNSYAVRSTVNQLWNIM